MRTKTFIFLFLSLLFISSSVEGVKQPVYKRLHFNFKEMARDGGTVTLPNGSVWSVKEEHQEIAQLWMEDDLIRLERASTLNSPYRYQLMNVTTNEEVAVEQIASATPFTSSESTLKITSIDSNEQMVYLNDGTAWHIVLGTYAVEKVFHSEWEAGHVVIIGFNGRKARSNHPYFIYNSHLDKKVSAGLY